MASIYSRPALIRDMDAAAAGDDERPLALQPPHVGERVQVLGDVPRRIGHVVAVFGMLWHGAAFRMTRQQLSRLCLVAPRVASMGFRWGSGRSHLDRGLALARV